MPRKSINELKKEEIKEKDLKTSTKKSTTEKKSAVAKKSVDTKVSTSTDTTGVIKPISKVKKSSTSKKSASTKKSPTTVKPSAVKKSTTSLKSSSSKRTKTTKSSTTKKNDKKTISSKVITPTTDLTKKIEVLEYYDLPYRYNQTIVKLLAQTPTNLFIYWDISDVDRENFISKYGEDFFNNTKPVLVIHNISMHYSMEIEIDDFSNSWYLHVNDANCEYRVELGRRTKYTNEKINFPNNYLYVTSSNVIESPNDRVLFDKTLKTVYFKDVKTNIVTSKDITSISFLRNMGRIYNLYDLQSDFNKNNWPDSGHLQLDLKNPSSANSSLTFK